MGLIKKRETGFSQILNIMPYIRVNIHLVWSTKNRIPYLDTPQFRQEVWNHIFKNGREKGIFIECINGFTDHCHCIISLSADQCISKVVQLIKGESSFWINKNYELSTKFEWQDEYFAVAVAEPTISNVKEYIHNQEKHHQAYSFEHEYQQFINKNGFKEG